MFAPAEKFVAWFPTTIPTKSFSTISQLLEDHLDHPVIDGVHLGMEFQTGHAVADIDERCARVLSDDLVLFLQIGQEDDPWIRLQLHIILLLEVIESKGRPPSSDRRIQQPFFSISSIFLGTFFLSFFMTSTASRTPMASQVSKGPSWWL